jgi:FkbM family methyltransferase
LSVLRRVVNGVRQRRRTAAFRRSLDPASRDDLILIGEPGYGQWVIAQSPLGPDSVCYLAGTGTDISFDLGLIERFGCTVHAFDPVPAANQHVTEATQREPRLIFHPIGLWSTDKTLRFYEHTEPGYVSHSATNMHRTEQFFEAAGRSVESMMKELSNDHLDLLKLSVEGSEHEILSAVLDNDLDVRQICVEFAQPSPRPPIDRTIEHLESRGHRLISVDLSPWNWKLTFLRGAPA